MKGERLLSFILLSAQTFIFVREKWKKSVRYGEEDTLKEGRDLVGYKVDEKLAGSVGLKGQLVEI